MNEERTPFRRDHASAREPANGAGSMHQAQHRDSRETPDEYDALTELFLGGGMNDVSPNPGESSRLTVELGAACTPSIEILVTVSGSSMGAGLVYADGHHAAAGRPVAVCQIGPREASITVLDSHRANGAPVGSLAPSSFTEAVAVASKRASAWVVEVDELSALELLSGTERDRVSRVIVATSSDEASVVAAYRAIKQIASVVPSTRELALLVLDPRVEAASRAADKIVRCADAFLARRIALVAVSPHPMRAVAPLFVGACPAPIAGVLSQIGGGVSQPTRTTEPSTLRMRQGVPGRDAAPVLGETVAERGEAGTVAAPSSLAVTVGGDLNALSVRCPHAENVEFAVDARGTLHLLALAAGDHGDDAGEAKAVASLLMAAAWARAHHGLIAAAEPGVQLARAAPRPILHLVTDRMRHARHLLDADIRVHLLAPVRSQGGINWACAELN